MKDIDILENMIAGFKKADIPQYKKEDLWTYCKYEQYKAIENLLKENKADKDRIKELEVALEETEELLEDSIPKSLVKEKIKEVKQLENASISDILESKKEFCIDVLQELLGEKQ